MRSASQNVYDRVEKFIEKLDGQERLCRELRDVSNQQIDELDRNEGPALEILAEKKRRILEKVDQIGGELRTEYRIIEPALETLSDAMRLKIEIARLKTSEALKVAIETEEHGGERAQAQIEKLSEDMAEVKRARRVAEKYKPVLNGEDEPKFLDKRQ